MAFWGGAFVFDGVPCEEYELMVYDLGSHTQSDSKFASGVSIVEEKIPTRWKPYFYGVKFEDKLTFKLVFGVNERRVDAYDFLSRQEMEAVASWLTGHDGYRWLEIIQPDMEPVRYRCMITKLDVVEHRWIPWAFEATVECDGPYGYLYPREYTFSAGQSVLYCESSHDGYYPKMEIVLPDGGGDIAIENASDGGRGFRMTGVPTMVKNIFVNCDTGVISSDAGINLYPYCNFQFLRLVRGENILNISCGVNAEVKVLCEYPYNAGG